MSSSLPAQHRKDLDGLPLRSSTLKAGLRQKTTQDAQTLEMTPEMLTAVVLDEAVIAAGMTNKGIAMELGISESIVARWRSPHARECPSLLQVTKLGPDFQRLMHRGFARRYGWRRKALLDLAAAMGDLAEAVNE